MTWIQLSLPLDLLRVGGAQIAPVDQFDSDQIEFIESRLISIPVDLFPPKTPIQIREFLETARTVSKLEAKLDLIAQIRHAKPAVIKELCCISTVELNRALKILDGLTPELLEAVREGRMAPTTAAKAVRLDAQQQRELADLPKIKVKDVDLKLKEKTARFVDALPLDLFAPVPVQDQRLTLAHQLMEYLEDGTEEYRHARAIVEGLNQGCPMVRCQ